MTFADKLQSLRKTKKLSQEDLAEKCGVTRQSVSKWETGLGYPETEKLPIIPAGKTIPNVSDYFINKKCDIKLKQEQPLLGFNKP